MNGAARSIRWPIGLRLLQQGKRDSICAAPLAHKIPGEVVAMKISSVIRAALVALTAFAGAALSAAAHAESAP